MAFIRNKMVKGKTYSYQVESYRDSQTGKVKQRVLKYLGAVAAESEKLGTTKELLPGAGVSLSLCLDGRDRQIEGTVTTIPYCPAACVAIEYLWSGQLRVVQVPRSKVS